MNISITFGEAMDRGIWLDLCDLKGINEWCVNEGCADGSEAVHLSVDEAQQLGLLLS